MTRRKRHGERFTNPNIQRPGVLNVVKSFILQKINAFCQRMFGPTLWFFLSKFVQVFWAVLVLTIPLALMGWETWNRRHQAEFGPCFDIERDFTTQELARMYDCGTRKVLPGEWVAPERVRAQSGEFPWMARLLTYVDNKTFETAGSIIHEQYILTSATAFRYLKKKGLEYVLNVYVGEKYKKSGRKWTPEYAANYVAENLIFHPKYDSENLTNDICLVKLEEKLKFSVFVYPICLPIYCDLQRDQFHSFNILTAAAWGAGSQGLHMPHKFLQRIRVTPTSFDKCKSPMLSKNLLKDTVICSSSVVGKTVCQGDAGGPLMYEYGMSGISRTYVVGVVSHGDWCGVDKNETIKAVFTRVGPYLRWIFDTIADSY